MLDDTSPVSRGIIIVLWLWESLLMEGDFCGMPESFQEAGSMTSQGLQFRVPAAKQDGPRGGSEVGILRKQQGSWASAVKIIVINLVLLLQGSGTRDDDGWGCMSADVPATGFVVLTTVRFGSLIGRLRDAAPSAGN